MVKSVKAPIKRNTKWSYGVAANQLKKVDWIRLNRNVLHAYAGQRNQVGNHETRCKKTAKGVVLTGMRRKGKENTYRGIKCRL